GEVDGCERLSQIRGLVYGLLPDLAPLLDNERRSEGRRRLLGHGPLPRLGVLLEPVVTALDADRDCTDLSHPYLPGPDSIGPSICWTSSRVAGRFGPCLRRRLRAAS